ncbi:MAG: phosphoenolpyruvate carboxylase [Labilithrix sp.]|nr:phosphoenolpyruvate carboxylase [Labilithrix sp.]
MALPFDALRRDVSYLGRILGDTLVEQEGDALLDLEETIRALAKARRAHEAAHDVARAHATTQKLVDVVRGLDTSVAERVARAFTHYFQLVNLAEQHHRTRRRRDYAREGKPQPGSLEVVFAAMSKEASRERFIEVLRGAAVELVFTAHPSEAQRRTVLEKHRRLVSLIARRERAELTPAEADDVDRAIREEVATLWQSDEIRQEKPRVGDEVKNVLFYLEEVLFPLVPGFYKAMESAAAKAFGKAVEIPCVLHFGSWVGADMDGNPNVTPEVAVDTGLAQTARVIDLYLREVASLGASLSQSTRRVAVTQELLTSLEADARAMPELVHTLETTTHHEPYRRKLRFVAERLRVTRAAIVAVREAAARDPSADVAPRFAAHAYAGPAAFVADLELILASLLANRGERAGAERVRALLRQVRTFGFHLARLDVRIPAEWVRADARVALGLAEGATLTCAALEAALDPARAPELVVPDGPGLRAVRALARIREVTFGGGAESLVLSMTHGAEDMLAALVLARLVLDAPGATASDFVAIVPLFETLDDLDRSDVELSRAVTSAPYAAYLARRGGVQEVMIGYSDSNKDAGIVGSSFALYRAQQRLVAVSREHGVSLKIFHGRGGSIGRGGGPSQRAIESLPAGSVSGRFKLTEQGEVLGWKYLVPEIAERNLELTVAGVLAHSLAGGPGSSGAGARGARLAEYEAIFEEVASISVAHYRALVSDPGFPEYFAATTPIEDIPRLNIGSRPARRSGGRGGEAPRVKLEDLRAIPWVFAWTQSRQMVPGWYGAGRALAWLLKQHGPRRARQMRKEWPFFASTLDAIAVSLAQADMVVASRYADLCEDVALARRLFRRIALDHGRAVRAIRTIFERPDALEPDSTLARSIELRNPYVDPLSFIQIELLRRERAEERESPELLRAILLTINGVAAGLRSTG